MADIYLRSTDGLDTDNGSSWALAKATLAGALAIAAAGDRIFVADGHAETQASAMTLTSAGVAGNRVYILCVDDTGDPSPPTALATTATVSTTGASGMTFNGFAYVYGVTFQVGTGATNANLNINGTSPYSWIFDTCGVGLLNTGGTAQMNLGNTASAGSDDQHVVLLNTVLRFGATGQKVNIGMIFLEWLHTASAISGAGAVPTTLLATANSFASRVEVLGVDLSAAGAGKNLVSLSGAAPHRVALTHCKLGASVNVMSGTIDGPGGAILDLYSCDSGDTNYRTEHYEWGGSVLTVTDVVRSGGATADSLTVARKLAAGANVKFTDPLRLGIPLMRRLRTTGAKTVRVYYLHGEASALKNDEIWLEVDYLGTSGFPLSSRVSDAKAHILATGANQDADSSQDWDNGLTARANSTAYSLGDIRRAATANGRAFVVTTAGTSGGSEPAAFATAADGDSITDNTVTWRCMRREYLQVALTNNELGPITGQVALAKPSISVWVDPMLVVS